MCETAHESEAVVFQSNFEDFLKSKLPDVVRYDRVFGAGAHFDNGVGHEERVTYQQHSIFLFELLRILRQHPLPKT